MNYIRYVKETENYKVNNKKLYIYILWENIFKETKTNVGKNI